MKRGYMDPNVALLPDELLEARRVPLLEKFEEYGVDAVVIYGDVATADELQYLANLGPYWGSATCILDKSGSRSLVTGMTARVNFWVSMMSRVPLEQITAAGPNVDKVLAKFLSEHYPAGAIIGMVGEYFPAGMQAMVEGAGFTTVWMDAAARELLTLRDDGYRATLTQGIGLMNKAIPGALEGAQSHERTMQMVAADVEYACRTAGAMDVVLLCSDRNLTFGKAPDKRAEAPWTLYMQLQYLGDWMTITRNVEPSLNSEAFAVRDRVMKDIKPGTAGLYFTSDSWDVALCTDMRSDHPAYRAAGETTLRPGQVISLRLCSAEKGIMIEDMALITEVGARLLTDI